MHRLKEAVFLALLPQREESCRLVVGETRDPSEISRLVGCEHLVPHEATCARELGKLLRDCCIGLQTVFVALAYLHRTIIQLVYEEHKRFSHWKTLCFCLARPFGLCDQIPPRRVDGCGP